MGFIVFKQAEYTKNPRLHCIDCGEWLKTWNDGGVRKLWCSGCRGLKIGGVVVRLKDKLKMKKIEPKIIGAFER